MAIQTGRTALSLRLSLRLLWAALLGVALWFAITLGAAWLLPARDSVLKVWWR